MAIEVNLTVCILAASVLVWLYWDVQTVSKIHQTVSKIHEDLQTLNSKVDDIIKTGITVREKQKGALEKWAKITCKSMAIFYPIGIVCDFVLELSNAIQ